jgi:LmbE family N-acetylglucosaminyl deacetylase
MAFHGIVACYADDDQWFCGVTVCDGRGGPRKKEFEDLSPLEMSEVRNKEQNNAADRGRYGAMVQLNFPSPMVKSSDKNVLVGDLLALLNAVKPSVVYTHNPADKHETHVGVSVATLETIRRMAVVDRPQKLIGSEVWRDLDWMNDADKLRLDVTGHDELASGLIGCFASQLTPEKRYDLASLGRRPLRASFNAHTLTWG